MNRPLVAPVVRRGGALALLVVLLTLIAPTARAEERMYFPAYENVTSVLVAKINAETVRVDISAWYLTEHAISIALLNRFHAGVPVRLIGDRVAIFESDPLTKREFYWLAAQGVPIRLRYYPEWFPEIVHWKAAIFVGQGEVAFGSANFTPFELAPVSAADYKDETVLVTDDSSIVNAFKTMFDRFWTDVTTEPRSRIVNPPFFKDWNEACALESACADFATLHPNPTPMVIDRRRLEPDYPLPAEMVWSQGPAFNNRLIQEIDREATQVDLVAYRLTVSTVADALIRKFQSGVPVRFMVDPEQYTSRVWPEYWLTRANVDRMWVAGIPIRQRVHTGLTHMKTLITSAVATNASSNIAEFWQRDHNYFIPSATKPQLHQALRDRFEEMWSDPNAFGPFTPLAADAARLVSPLNGSGGLPGGPTLTWARAPFATSYDIYLGSSGGTMTRVANVPAVLSSTPPDSYSWTPVTPLAPGTTYQWRVVSRTFATDVNPALVAASSTWSFTTQASTGGNPLPSGWSTRDVGATGLAGSAGYANGVFTVSGAGADIWGNSDAFRFVYQTLTGDGEIVARVVTQQNTHQYAKAGIMIRQSLAANAAHVILDTVPAPGTEFMTRGATGAATAYLGGTTAGAPRWLRLTRSGTSVAAAVSANGSSWTTVGSATLPAGTAYVGLIVSSLNTAQLNTSTFDNVSVNGGTAPPPPL
ncbi:MAG: phospholipase D-like domain-containing protein, partial [Vicinamibacterales bacterium]